VALASVTAPTFLAFARFAQCGTTAAPISFTDLRLSLPVSAMPDAVHAPEAQGQSVSFIGLVETQSRDLRVAVLRVDGRVVYGREGDVVAGRYRLLRFSEEAARVFDLSSSLTRTLAMGSQQP